MRCSRCNSTIQHNPAASAAASQSLKALLVGSTQSFAEPLKRTPVPKLVTSPVHNPQQNHRSSTQHTDSRAHSISSAWLQPNLLRAQSRVCAAVAAADAATSTAAGSLELEGLV